MKFDGKAFGEEIVGLTRSFVERTLAPVMARLAGVEKELAEARAELAARPDVAAEVEKALADQPKPERVDFETMIRSLEDRMAERLAAWPKAPTAEEVAALVPAPSCGVNGKDAGPELIIPIVREAVAALPAVPTAEEVAALLPKPRDGKDGTDGLPGAPGERGEKGADGLDGKDGIGLADALIDRDGALVVTLTNGTTKTLGRVVGGEGVPGKDGRDGFSLEDFAVVRDGERGFKFTFSRGDVVKEFGFSMPVVLDRGVFKDGTEYEAGDGTTFGGSFWIAQATTKDKPGTSDAWRLSVKKGRDGKDGEAPKPPPVVKL